MKGKYRRKNQRSFVLITAIIIISVLMVAVWEFSFVVSQNLRIAANMVKEVQAISIARAAFRGSVAILLRADTNHREDGPHDTWRKVMPPLLPLGFGSARLSIEAEDGKLNVNHLVQPILAGVDKSEQLDLTHYRYLKALFDILGYEIKSVDGIVDVIDKNNMTFGEGAEKEYYENLHPPITIKNGPLDSINELLMVKGISVNMFYGLTEEQQEEKQGGKEAHKTGEKPAKNIDKEKNEDEGEEEVKIWAPSGLKHYLTVYGDLDKSSNHSLININFMPLKLLQAINEDIDDFTLKEIEKFRQGVNFSQKNLTAEFMSSNFGQTAQEWNYFFTGRKILKASSEYYRIRGIGDVDNITRIVEAVIQRKGKSYKILYYIEI